MSTAMMGERPSTRAIMTALNPTAPAPNTTRLFLVEALNVLMIDPAPVWIPHGSAASSSAGMSLSMRTTSRSSVSRVPGERGLLKKCAGYGCAVK